MNLSISLVAVVVRDYDDAIKFYFVKLGFESVENTYQAEQEKSMCRCDFSGKWSCICIVGDSCKRTSKNLCL